MNTSGSATQAKYSTIDFDYMAYSRMKWARYHDCKESVTERVTQHFSQA